MILFFCTCRGIEASLRTRTRITFEEKRLAKKDPKGQGVIRKQGCTSLPLDSAQIV